MRAIRHFDECVREGIVKKQHSDSSRATFLFQEAENSYHNLHEKIQKIKMHNGNANDFVKSCYDIIMELIRAKMLLAGYNASGVGAHEAEVAYLRVLAMRENDVQFVDQMRFFRNGMLYYGTRLDTEYAEKVIAFTKRIYAEMKKK